MNFKILIGLCVLLPLCLGAVCAADVSSADDSIVSDLPALAMEHKSLYSEHPLASTDAPVLAKDYRSLYSEDSTDAPLAKDYRSLYSERPLVSTDLSLMSPKKI